MHNALGLARNAHDRKQEISFPQTILLFRSLKNYLLVFLPFRFVSRGRETRKQRHATLGLGGHVRSIVTQYNI